MEKTEGKIRYGLIGIGAQGGSYARFLTNAPAPFPGMVCAPCPDNCALGALCDIDPEKEKMCKEQYPDVPFFKDWKDMIASGTVDAIITTVPHYLHHEISIYAMEHGMNVLCSNEFSKSGKTTFVLNVFLLYATNPKLQGLYPIKYKKSFYASAYSSNLQKQLCIKGSINRVMIISWNFPPK